MTYACIFLPLPPSTNNLYANSKWGGRHKTKAYSAWIAEAHYAWLRQRLTTPRFESYVDLTLSVERTSRARQDASNKIKAVEDFLVHVGVLADDSHVRRVTAQWHRNIVGCRVEIESAPDIAVDDPVEIGHAV